jgi:hypothetical protein
MELLVDRAEVLAVDVGVELCGGQIGVSEHLLDRPEIGPALEEMGGKGVAEGVRGDPFGKAGPLSVTLDDAPGAYP